MRTAESGGKKAVSEGDRGWKTWQGSCSDAGEAFPA